MSAELLVRFCSPTLAGLKVANLFSYKYENKEEILMFIMRYNKLLNKKGVFLKLLKCKDGMALILVYREKKLVNVLENENIQQFLKEYDYEDFDIENCIEKLKKHLIYADFPHEIGIFLGYPLEDVKAFIKYKGMGYKYVGCWKVYTNEEEAINMFSKFEKCSKIYKEKFSQGTEITRLAVAV